MVAWVWYSSIVQLWRWSTSVARSNHLATVGCNARPQLGQPLNNIVLASWNDSALSIWPVNLIVQLLHTTSVWIIQCQRTVFYM